LTLGKGYVAHTLSRRKKEIQKQMRKLVSLLAFVVLSAAMMYGQATRTWVSGVGDDANPCSRTAPCKTFAGAISKTAPGGEIDALDPGGFGALTITKSITLDGGGGQVASVLVAGTNGIVVAAQAADVVIIRNMRLDGLLGGGNGNAGLNGIRWISGKALHIENCTIFGFSQNGIDIEKADGGRAFISGSVLANNGVAGILSKNTTATVTVTVTNTITSDNQFGMAFQDFTNASVFNSEITGSPNGGLQSLVNVGGTSTVEVYNSSISHNTIGVFSGGTSTVWISGVALFDNSSGIVLAGGTVNSAKNNFNNTTGTPSATPGTFVQ
jgi:hypothetical protein